MSSSWRLIRLRLAEAQNNRCCYCGSHLTDLAGETRFGRVRPTDATLDHVKPIAQGGGDDQENLVVACWRCNNQRGTMAASAFFYRVTRPEIAIVHEKRVLQFQVRRPKSLIMASAIDPEEGKRFWLAKIEEERQARQATADERARRYLASRILVDVNAALGASELRRLYCNKVPVVELVVKPNTYNQLAAERFLRPPVQRYYGKS